MKLVINIIALVVLIVGFVLAVFAKYIITDNKNKGELTRKQVKLSLIGYIICGFAALIFLIGSFF
ncbi:MAG: hypothetical protein K6F08_03820 [bacterium]|nr:hypothetical protein [bacterium]